MQVQNSLNSLITKQTKDSLKKAENFNEILEQMAKFDESIKDSQSTQDNDFSVISKKLQKQISQDDKLFKTFDFMQIMNELIYGNASESQKMKLLQKANEIAKSVK